MLTSDDTVLLPGLRMDLGRDFMVELSLPELGLMDTHRPRASHERERSVTLQMWHGVAVTTQNFTPFKGTVDEAVTTLRGIAELFSNAADRAEKALESTKR